MNPFTYIDEFRNPLNENLSFREINEIPGIRGVTFKLNKTKFEIITSHREIYIFNISEIKPESDLKIQTHIYNKTKKLFNKALMALTDSSVLKKWEVLQEAEEMELFDDIISKSGFYNYNIGSPNKGIEDNHTHNKNLISLRSSGNSIPNILYSDTDQKLIKFLQNWLEIICAKCWIYTKIIKV